MTVLIAFGDGAVFAARSPSKFYHLISVGCGGVTDDGVGHIVWHPDVATVAPEASTPEFPAGPARLVGTVQVVDPTQCDEYGCDRASIRTQDGVNVEVQRPSLPSK
jgi:hypothetical protein